MRPALSTAVALLLGTTACAPGLRTVDVVPAPEAPGHLAPAIVSHPERHDTDEWLENGNAPLADLPAPIFVESEIETIDDAVSLPLAPSWDIAVLPYASHERVAFYAEMFGGTGRERFAERLRRGSRYEGMIRDKLAAADLPEDLYYLALIESGFDQHAYSRAAAVGMWQFMTTTARSVGLRVDWWVDERRDPVRSTDAAIRYLRWLRAEFDGSLYLAAAAYNGGSGRIGRGLARHADALAGVAGDDRFFALAGTGSLRTETREYVPQLIAAAMVAKSEAVRSLTADVLPPFAYDSVLVPGGTPLAAVGRAVDVPLPAVLDLNGHLLRGATPPGAAAYVRVPVGAANDFEQRFAELPADARRGFTRVTTKNNGRLSAIARKHGYSEAQLAAFNPGVKRNKRGLLVGGQTVLVPSRSVVGAALDVADPDIEIYGSTSSVRGRKKAEPRTYTVVAGDVLGRIARAHDLSVAQLRRLNRLKSDIIRPGQVLAVNPNAAPGAAAKVRSTSRN